MHELAICEELLAQVERIAREHTAAVRCVHVRVGLNSGIEPTLLERAYSVACAGTAVEGVRLAIEYAPLANGEDLLLLTVDLDPVWEAERCGRSQ